MLDILKVTILSFVEGLTEFIPVSSTGHLILVNQFVNLEPESFSKLFEIVIQLGAILSVMLVYFNRLNPFSVTKNKKQRHITIQLWKRVIIGCIPAAILGFLLDDFIDEKLMTPQVVTFTLFFWGIVIIFIEKRHKKEKITSITQMSYKTAFLIGMYQCLALVPGTSRSAATIIGAMLLGCSRVVAAEFSFFLAIPVMFGATFLKIAKAIVKGTFITPWHVFLVILGMMLSFFFALVVIKKFMKYVKEHDFVAFGIYRIVLSVLVGLYFFVLK